MELSEAVSVPNSSEDSNPELQSSQVHSPRPDPALHDADHAATDDPVHAELQKLDLKDKEVEEAEKVFDDGGEWSDGKNSGDGDAGESDRFRDIDNENGDKDEEVNGGDAEIRVETRGEWRSNSQHPVRPEAEDCAYYIKTGTCKFGSYCKFNHPVGKRNQGFTERVRNEEDSFGQSSKAECKYYLKTGGCKFGDACRYNHTRGRTMVAPVLELNFLGLPIRPDEKECPYYMRTGSCKYGANCRFNHPDPTTVAVADSATGFNNGLPLRGVSQPQIGSWTSPRPLNETTPFLPAMISPSQAQDPEWRAFQAPIYPSEISLLPPPTYVVNNLASDTDLYALHRQVEEYPERPGQPECSYFLKTGDCKFKSLCKYHHPKNRNAKSLTCALNDKGLPLRPDQNICTYYSRYGICKFGPACKFDHPVLPSSSTVSEHERPPPSYGNFTAGDGVELAGGGSGNNATIKQSA